jgi:hypothetical protein
MIIVKLSGGLGNQLFQYAFARSVSSKLKTTFKLDQTPFHTYYTLHKYSLQNFTIQENPAKPFDFFGFVWFRSKNNFFNTFYKYLRLKSKLMPFYYPEQVFHFDERVFKKDGVYFDGFWQTERYFKDIGAELRKEIQLNRSLSDYSTKILEEILSSTAVSLHIRRADYVSNAATNAAHGTCSLEYYQGAITYIANKVKNPHFFVFSDDYQWSVENFSSLPYPVTCIKNGADKNYEDLMLMSSCKHNIIANSSFSWWGAWLNSNKEKIVIGPSQWFKSTKQSVNTKDVMPEEWLKM